MFDTKAGWPTEVRQPLLAPVVTNQVVRDAIEVCNELCDRAGPSVFDLSVSGRVRSGVLLAQGSHADVKSARGILRQDIQASKLSGCSCGARELLRSKVY